MGPVVLLEMALEGLPVIEQAFGQALQEALVVLVQPWTSSWAVHSSSGAGLNWTGYNAKVRTTKSESVFVFQKKKPKDISEV